MAKNEVYYGIYYDRRRLYEFHGTMTWKDIWRYVYVEKANRRRP